jgi:hypothetical protein
MKRERVWWIGGFVVAFGLGLALTLWYGWVLDPRYAPVKPAHLNRDDQEVYLVLIAAAFRHDHDLEKARARLVELKQPNLEDSLVNLAERYIAEGRDARDIYSLVNLADALGRRTATMGAFLATPTAEPSPTPIPASPRPTSPPAASPTMTPSPRPEPTVTPTPTPTEPTASPRPDTAYGLAQSVAICDADTSALLRVYVRDRRGRGVAGVKVMVIWPGGQDTFYTGFKPEIDPGYADFVMEPDRVYRLALGDEPAEAVDNISVANSTLCSNLPDGYAPSWQVVFRQGAEG